MKHNGLTLGVLGGMGPAATAEFQRLLAVKAPATCDQEHPRMIVYSHTVTPDRTTYLLGKGPDPEPYLLEGLQTLIGWGADRLAVTCNTAHHFIDRFIEQGLISVPVIHIIEETVRTCRERSPQGAWLTATLGTMKTGLYQRHGAASGYRLRIPEPAMQEEIHVVTDLVKGGQQEEAGRRYHDIVERLWQIERIPVVLACTELPVAYQRAGLPPEMGISSLESLADGCIRELYKPL
ncbi:MAG: aspartate/glutamate racemase family protein [Bacteroidales bacterium]|jgi:aspartate racemase|nr:aspartate/glutamate racemase family protein [Bacteroidales bacterium]